MNEQELQNSLKELMKLVKASIESFGKYTKAKATGVTGDELAKLESAKTASRTAFDSRLAAVIGDLNTDEGKSRSRDWGFYVQKSFIFGLVGNNAFRYVNPRQSQQLRLTAEAHVRGHKVLGWTVEHGVNPRSVQTLAGALEKALVKAREEGDPNRVQEIQSSLSELKRHAHGLLQKKVEQKRESQTGSFKLADTLGLKPGTLAMEAASATPEAPKETPPVSKKSRRSR